MVPLARSVSNDKCLDAKILELNDEFKAKLGWLVGDMYSRVGTKDWEYFKERKDFLKMIETDLKDRFVISDKKKLNLLLNNINETGVSFENSDTMSEYIDALVVKSNYDEIMDIIENIVKKQTNLGTNDERQMLIRKIRSNSQIRSYVK